MEGRMSMNMEVVSFRKFILSVVICLAAFSSAVYPAVIQVTSQAHRIWGEAAGTANPDSFDITDSSPVSYVASADWWNGVFSPEQPGVNRVSAAAGSLEVFTRDDSAWTFTGSHAYADSSYTFRPLLDSFGLRLDGQVELHSFENEIRFTLLDLTNNVEIRSMSWTTEETDTLFVNWFETFAVNPDFEYRLDLHAHVYPGDIPGVTSRLAADFVIPEPASLALLCLGTAAVLVRKHG